MPRVKNKPEINWISNCIKHSDSQGCSNKCGKGRTHKSFKCNTECLKENEAKGKVREGCRTKSKRQK